MATEDDVRRLALGLAEVTERPSYGTPAFRVDGTVFARLHEEPGVLVCWTPSLEDKEALLAAEPGTLFTTEHYDGHASVLIRLERINVEELEELLIDAWAARAPARLRRTVDG